MADVKKNPFSGVALSAFAAGALLGADFGRTPGYLVPSREDDPVYPIDGKKKSKRKAQRKARQTTRRKK